MAKQWFKLLKDCGVDVDLATGLKLLRGALEIVEDRIEQERVDNRLSREELWKKKVQQHREERQKERIERRKKIKSDLLEILKNYNRDPMF